MSNVMGGAGSPAPPARRAKRKSTEDRFFDKVDLRDFSGCWPWTGYIQDGKYGTFSDRSRGDKLRTILVHRYSYQFFNPDEDIDGVTIHHICGCHYCVNPDHLQAVSHINNVAEMNERQFYLRKIAQLEAEVAELKGLLNGNQARY